MAPPPSDPSDFNYWPTAPPQAHYGGNMATPSGFGWRVELAPPEPWPFIDEPLPPTFGPAGTEWVFTPGDILNRIQTGLDGLTDQIGKAYLRRAKIPYPLIFPVGSFHWFTEGVPDMPGIDVWRVAIHARLNGVEDAINVLHFREGDGGTASHDLTEIGCQGVGAQVAAAWSKFLLAVPAVPAAGGNIPLNFFKPEIVWDELRVARLHVESGQSKPQFLVNTQYVPQLPAIVPQASGGSQLPYEVSMAVSLGTGARGARNRGRMYLPPMGSNTLDAAGGLFNPAACTAIAECFMANFVIGLAGDDPSPLQLVVASMKFGTMRDVSQVRVGVVPDSQRRRRRSIPEAYAVAGAA